MKMVADKHSHAAGNIHFDGINVDDWMTPNPKNRGF